MRDYTYTNKKTGEASVYLIPESIDEAITEFGEERMYQDMVRGFHNRKQITLRAGGKDSKRAITAELLGALGRVDPSKLDKLGLLDLVKKLG